jgi:uncharacterized protein (TIGR02246 family)
MRRMPYVLGCLVAALSMSASAADLKQEVDKLTAAYAEAVSKQDGAGIARLFSKDGVLVNSTGPHTDIAQTEDRAFKNGINHLETKADQVWPLGADGGIGLGDFRLTGKSPSGAPLEFVGRWTAAYVLEDGKWKIRMLSAFPKAQPPADKATIEKLNDAFASAFGKGDFAAVGAMYTEDAVALPPGSATIKGRSNIQAFWTQAGQGISDVKLTTVEVKPLGPDSAREIGTFSLMTKGQQIQQVAGKYVVVWQRVGNDWKLATDIWNADK